MIESSTPSRLRFDAKPPRKACQPVQVTPARRSTSFMWVWYSQSRASGFPSVFAKIGPVVRLPHALRCTASRSASCGITGTGAFDFSVLGSPMEFRQTERVTCRNRLPPISVRRLLPRRVQGQQTAACFSRSHKRQLQRQPERDALLEL